MNGNDRIRYNIYSLYNPTTTIIPYPSIDFTHSKRSNEIPICADFHTKRNMILPPKLAEQTMKSLNHYDIKVNKQQQYNLIFGVGGGSDNASMIIIYPMEYIKNEMIGFYFNLQMPEMNKRGTMLFVDSSTNGYYGMVSIGGLSRVFIDSICYWQYDDVYSYFSSPFVKIGKLCKPKEAASPVQIGSNIMIIGGYGNYDYSDQSYKKVEWFDLKTKKCTDSYISSCKYSRYSSIVHYNELLQHVYVVGGAVNYSQAPASKFSNEYYNIYKNKWYPFASTNFGHHYGGCMWMEQNVLFVRSDWDKFESIDLRDNKKKWSKICTTSNDKSFEFDDKNTWTLLLDQ